MKEKVQGFLLLFAAVLIVAGGAVAVMISQIMTNDSSSVVHDNESTQAFYIANAGLQRALDALTTNVLSEMKSCTALTGDADYTNVSVGSGQFTVTGTMQSVSSASLSSAITSSTTIIPMSGLTNYSAAGLIMIDGEALEYTRTSTSSGDCGGAAQCLLGVTRGYAGTTAVSHSSGVAVVQARCEVSATGGVPDLTDPDATRVISMDLFSLDQGWMVGNKISGGENILQMAGGVWSQYGPSASLPDIHLYGIELLNYADGWIVGQKDSGKASLFHWDGSNWARVLPASGTPNADLNGVSCVASNDCWAVGDSKTFIHWDGSSWTNGATTGLPNMALNAVDCVASNDCWAVGPSQGGNTYFAHWDGSIWSRVMPSATVPNPNLEDVTCTASNSCWAVGGGSTYVYWNGSDWVDISPDVTVPNKQIRSISCVDANDCWAVGSPSGGDALITHWNGSTWTRVMPDGTVSGSSLSSVSCFRDDKCWATGGNGNVIYWNGSTWTDATPAAASSATLHALGSIGPPEDTNPVIANWQES